MYKRLKELQQVLKLSIKEFAERCGIPYRTMQSYLLNTHSPTAQNIQKITETFDVNINWLLSGKGTMFMSKKSKMPTAFIDRVKKDISTKKESIKSLSFKDKLDKVLSGEEVLSRLEVIELSRKLNQPLGEYLMLSNYVSDIFDKVLANHKFVGALRSMDQLSDKEVDEVMEALSLVLEGYVARKEKEKGKDKDKEK